MGPPVGADSGVSHRRLLDACVKVGAGTWVDDFFIDSAAFPGHLGVLPTGGSGAASVNSGLLVLGPSDVSSDEGGPPFVPQSRHADKGGQSEFEVTHG